MDYEKILKEIVQIINTTEKSDIGFANICTYIGENCPELAESEDERIRKQILNYFVAQKVNEPQPVLDSWIAWLEKQCNTNKTIDRDEFAQGVLRGAAINLITWIDYNTAEGNMCLSNVQCKEIENALVRGDWNKIYAYMKKKLERQDEQKSIFDFNANNWCVSKVDGKIHNIYNSGVESKFHEGDWIVNNDSGNVFQVTEIRNDEYCIWPLDAEIMGYLRIIDVDNDYHLWTIQDAKDGDIIASDNSIFIFKEEYIAEKPTAYCGLMNGLFIEGNGACWTNEKCYPATKEQRDALEKAMADAGYTFDFEKKELDKIENEEYNGEDYGIDSLFHAQRILEKTLGKVEGYQTDDGILSHKCAITAVKKLCEQKSAEWSEEDEERLQSCINSLQGKGLIGGVDTINTKWLKSIKQRMKE